MVGWLALSRRASLGVSLVPVRLEYNRIMLEPIKYRPTRLWRFLGPKNVVSSTMSTYVPDRDCAPPATCLCMPDSECWGVATHNHRSYESFSPLLGYFPIGLDNYSRRSGAFPTTDPTVSVIRCRVPLLRRHSSPSLRPFVLTLPFTKLILHYQAQLVHRRRRNGVHPNLTSKMITRTVVW